MANKPVRSFLFFPITLSLCLTASGVMAPAPVLAAPGPGGSILARVPGDEGPSDDTRAQAKKHFDEGAALYTQGSYKEAIKAWEKAYELSEEPLIFENMANAYERLGELKKAREHLALWREAAPAAEHPLLDKRLANLDDRIAKQARADVKQPGDDKKKKKKKKKGDDDEESSGGDGEFSGCPGSAECMNGCKTKCEDAHGPMMDLAKMRECASGGDADKCVEQASNKKSVNCFRTCRGLPPNP